MTVLMQPVAGELPCKVCGSLSRLFGTVDRNRSCQVERGDPFAGMGPAGEMVPYHRCAGCRLLFTAAFDGFTAEDWQRDVYNADYIKVDPDYVELRPANVANFIATQFAGAKSARVLDYGGGNGTTALRLREAGFAEVTCYDPFVPQFSARPGGTFNLILAFEVAEHSPRPLETFADMASFAADESIIVFTTLLQPPNIEQIKLDWWYVGPRNGHVTLYTGDALFHIAQRINMHFASGGELTHVMFRRVPEFARHMFGKK